MTVLDPITVSLWLYAAQALAGIVLGSIFAYYHRSHRRAHLGFLALSFFALALFMLCSGLAIVLIAYFPANAATRQLLSIGAQMASYLQIALLLIGTLSMAREKPLRREAVIVAVGAALVVGLICAVAYVSDPPPSMHRLFMRVGVHHLAYATALLLMAITLLVRGAWKRGFGMRVAALAFGVCGLEQLQVFAIFVWQALRQQEVPWAAYLGIFDVFALPFLGLGLLIWMLDVEHSRALDASEKLERLTRFDALTGLANQRQLRERLADLCTGTKMFGRSAAVLLIELGRFDTLARSLGTDAGDTIMRAVADRLQRAVEPTSLRPARLEGHRFVVLLHTVSGSDEARLVAQRILRTICLPYRVGGQEVLLSANVGIALCPEHAGDPDSLIEFAELAAIRARDSGDGAVRVYAPELRREVRARMGLQIELRRALLAEQFELEYQPIVRPTQHTLAGFEALVRWRHPERGIQSPAIFLGTMEEMGLLAELDEWVMDQACQQAAQWNADRTDPIWMAVNVTAQSFRLKDFQERVLRTLERTKLAPTLLDLEITESTALADVDQAIACLNALREIGISASLDDFGTGYSSLSQLRRLPVGKIKIDRSFITDPRYRGRDGAIVRALVSLAHGLDLRVLIEGVETEDQLKLCERAGSDLLQGYLFSRPLPAEHCTMLLASGSVLILRPVPVAM